MSFDKAFALTVGLEGGYSNNPADPGLETKYGISKRAHPDVDINALTLDQARDIYRRDYWTPAYCDDMPERIGHLMFDAAVNHGVTAAIKLLQRALRVADDGVYGVVTRGQLLARDTGETASLLMAERAVYMTTCSAWPTFKRGWLKRCFEIARAA